MLELRRPFGRMESGGLLMSAVFLVIFLIGSVRAVLPGNHVDEYYQISPISN